MSGSYRVSALAFGFVRMWRGWSVVLPVIVGNAIVQALLIWPPFTYGAVVWRIVSAVLSGLVAAAAFAAIAVVALRAGDGPVRWVDVLATLRAHGRPYATWAILWGVAVAIGLALYVIPGVLIIALTPFLALAVLDGMRNPLAENFRVIGRRWARWLITTIIVILVLVIGWNLGGLAAFFLRGPFATLVVWLIGGWLIAWFATAYGLIYRGAHSARR